MNKNRLQEIITEEFILVESITKNFAKAVEAYQQIQLKQQQLRKKFVAEKDAKKKEKLKNDLIKLHKIVQKAESDFNMALKTEPVEDLYEGRMKRVTKQMWKKMKEDDRVNALLSAFKDPDDAEKHWEKDWNELPPQASHMYLYEGKLNEDVFKSFLQDDPAFKLHMATNTDKRKSVKARKTDKTWDDGVPVLKYIARASKKDSPLPKGKFKIIEDNKYGWWYYQVGNTWYGIQQKDYGTPPFEY
jgi:hypothetical protein